MIILAAGLAAAPLLMRLLIRAVSSRPENLGVTGNRLADCPASPNCVSTRATDPAHAIAPLTFDGEPVLEFNRLRSVVSAQPGARLLSDGNNYLHFEFTSRLMGFIDDVEFLLVPGRNEIHFRSASRLGYSDLGVNRKRMEAIRREFEQAGP